MFSIIDEDLVRHSFVNRFTGRILTKSHHSARSIQFANSGKPSQANVAHKWREATEKDIPFIEPLVNDEVRGFFGDVHFGSLIELSPHAIVIVGNNDQVVGFLCLNNYPNINALLPEVWTEWMRYHYKLNELQNQNTLFVHYMVWSYTLRYDYLHNCLEDLFLNDMKLEYVCLVAPPNDAGVTLVQKDCIKILFSRALPFGTTSAKKSQILHVCFRSSVVTKMRIHHALEDDNDDLVEILDATAPKLKNVYGDYYIAEIVSKNEPNRSIIVAEIDDQTVGMMCLNTNVDLETLNLNFELLPYHALRKCSFDTGFNEIQIKEIVMRESKLLCSGSPFEDLEDDTILSFSQGSLLTSTFESTSKAGSKALDNGSERLVWEQLQEQSSITMPVDSKYDNDIIKEWVDFLKKFEDRQAYYDECVRDIQLPLSDSNAMAIELFGKTTDLDERVSIDLVKAAFDLYRDRDYCILTIPTTAYLPKFLTYFTKAIPRSECSFPDNLYIIHKNNLYGSLIVTFLTEKNFKDVPILINYGGSKEITPGEQIMEMCQDFLSNPKSVYSILVTFSESILVGIIILRPATTIENLRLAYCLDAYENFDIVRSHASFGQIIYCYMSPLFLPNSTFIFKEIFRLTSFTSIYYAIRNEYQYFDFFNSLLPKMFPIKPRRLMVLPSIEDFEDIEPNPKVFAPPETSAIYYTSLRLCTLQRKQIDARIVVVGFGQTAKAFLETLIYKPESQHIQFTSITCICPAGVLEADMHYCANLGKLFPPDRLFSNIYLKQLELRVWVNFVSGYMTEIDRKNKYVVLDKKERVPYDKLFIFCGIQFDVPREVYSEKTPSNLILVNKLLQGKTVRYKIKTMIKRVGLNIIVYGFVPKAFAGVNYLLNSGIKGQYIHFIVPPIDNPDGLNTQTFDDEFVELVVYRELQKAGVNVYQNFKFVSWNVDRENNLIKEITFESRFECVTLTCALFISYCRQVVNRKTVIALKQSGLVFDGRIVIDADCRTSDKNIYAAGPITKYRRILYADRFRHVYYNSKEIGMKLALKMVDLYSNPDNKDSQEEPIKWVVPHYTLPLVESIVLPGNYYYIHIHQPGYRLPNFITKSLDNYGMDLVTGGPLKPKKTPEVLAQRLKETSNTVEEKLITERDYFRIYLDKNGFVKTIVCLSKQPFSGQNMIHLYGLHEKLLNNMKCKYLNGEITDFYEFFGSRWTHILHHDRFFKLMEINERIHRHNLDGNTEWLTELLEKETDGGKRELPREKREALINYYQRDEFRVKIQKNLFDFINENKETLFMYATPEILGKEFKR